MAFNDQLFFTPLQSHTDFTRDWDAAGLRDVGLIFDIDSNLGAVPLSHAHRIPRHILAIAPPCLDAIGATPDLRCWVNPHRGAIWSSPRAVLQLQHLARSGWLCHIDLANGHEPEYLEAVLEALCIHDAELAARVADCPLPGYPPGLEPSPLVEPQPQSRHVIIHPSTEVTLERADIDPETEARRVLFNPPSPHHRGCGCAACHPWNSDNDSRLGDGDSEDERWHNHQDAQENAHLEQLRGDFPEDTEAEHWRRAGYHYNDST